MPNLIYKTCLKTGVVSNTRYVQEAVCEKLARDNGVDVATYLDQLPPPRGMAKVLVETHRIHIGPSNSNENVK